MQDIPDYSVKQVIEVIMVIYETMKFFCNKSTIFWSVRMMVSEFFKKSLPEA